MNRKPTSAEEFIERGCGRCDRWNTPQCSVRLHAPIVEKLIDLMRSSGLREEIKWSTPCYTYDGKNIAIIGAFREYCVLSFFKGALLHDPNGILQKPGKNTQAARVIRLTDVHKVVENKSYLLGLIKQAIEIEKSGEKFHFEHKSTDTVVEFSEKLHSYPELRKAFENLSPGKQKAYLLYFAEPKTRETRLRRIEKCIPLILSGKGLYDKYNVRL